MKLPKPNPAPDGATHGVVAPRVKRNNDDVIGEISPLDRKLSMTGFNNQQASVKNPFECSLRGLEKRIRKQVAKAKADLPWLKFATFGDFKTDKNCYRSDANVLTISGVEGDYDKGLMPMSVAAQLLNTAGVAALLYETPSSTPESPRWRVFCPFSATMPPESREGFLARVNGVLGGVLASESFNLSQSYYFGNIEGKPPIETILVDGRYIDLAHDLIAGAIGRGGKADSDEHENDESRSGAAFKEAMATYLRGGTVDDFAQWAGENVWRDYEANSARAIDHTWANAIARCLKDGLEPQLPVTFEDETDSEDAKTKVKPSNFAMTPFKWQSPETVEPEAWLYGEAYARKYVSALGAASGVGKSMLVICEALAMASNKPLLGESVCDRPLCVSYVNLEDPIHNMTGRAIAAMKLHSIDPKDIEGRFFINGSETDLIIAEQTRSGGPTISRPVVEAIERNIRQNKVDVLIIDPFVSSHRVTENDAGAMDLVAGEWARMAQRMNISILLVHHVRKAGNDPSGEPRDITVNDLRGSGATLAKTRVVRLINTMSPRTARQHGLPDSYKAYLRVDNGKSNIGPAVDKAVWRHLVNVDLGRARVGAIEAWIFPALADGVTIPDTIKALDYLEDNGPWRTSVQSKEWTGSGIAKALSFNLKKADDLLKVKAIIKSWAKKGYLEVEMTEDNTRRPRPFHVVKGRPDDVQGVEFEPETDPENGEE